jgi:TctA family transporter
MMHALVNRIILTLIITVLVLESIVKINMNVLLFTLLGISTAAFAASSSENQMNSGILVWVFICFGVIVVMFQIIPAATMFLSVLKGLFYRSRPDISFSSRKDRGGN